MFLRRNFFILFLVQKIEDFFQRDSLVIDESIYQFLSSFPSHPFCKIDDHFYVYSRDDFMFMLARPPYVRSLLGYLAKKRVPACVCSPHEMKIDGKAEKGSGRNFFY